MAQRTVQEVESRCQQQGWLGMSNAKPQETNRTGASLRSSPGTHADSKAALVETCDRRHGQPDAYVRVPGNGDEQLGRCSLWWRDTPNHLQTRVGVIGHYVATNNRAAAQLLKCACRALADAGCAIAIGPMDGDTWHDYRLVIDKGVEPPFFMEPDHPDEYPEQLLDNGFFPLARYFSALDRQLDRKDQLAREAVSQLSRLGVHIRPLNLQDLDAELGRIYSIATASFQEHLLYKSIEPQEFLAMYRLLAPLLRPEFVLIAERDESPIGFAFAIPDRLQESREGSITTLIVKTVAVLPDHRYVGLSYWLLEDLRRRARNAGFVQVIYALMRDSGYMRRRVSQFASPIRRYALFAKELHL